MDYEIIEAAARRKRIMRIVLFLIILSTLPFYCAGFLLWGTAGGASRGTPTPFLTNTPLGGEVIPTSLPTVTPFSLTITVLAPLQPTPLQFFSGGGSSGGNGGVVPTAYIQPTVYIPPPTQAPTLTPFPTNPPPPSSTPVPLPTEPPLPTNTPVPLPTDAPTDTPIPLPTDAPTTQEAAP